MLIAVPSAIKVFNWLGTHVARQHPLPRARCCTRSAFVAMFVIGGLSAASSWPRRRWTSTSTTPTSSWRTSTTCCSAAACSPSSRAITFWYPKMFGRMMNAGAGQDPLLADVRLLQPGVLPDAQPRPAGPHAADLRPDQYEFLQPLQPLNTFISISAFVLFASQLIFAFNFIWSWFKGRKAPAQSVGRQRARVDGSHRRRRTATSGRSAAGVPRAVRVQLAAGRRTTSSRRPSRRNRCRPRPARPSPARVPAR